MGLGPLETQETMAKVVAIIEDSFDTRPMPSGSITRSEIDSRTMLAKEIFRVLWNEMRWSEIRILDHLPAFIARGLDGDEPIPSWVTKQGETESASWGAEAAGRVEKERRLSALATSQDVAMPSEPMIIIPGGYDGN